MKQVICIVTLVLAVGVFGSRLAYASGEHGIPPGTVTDYIHAVIESDRTFYTIHVVERLQKGGGSTAAENWRSKNDVLPLPAQFLMESSELAMKTGASVRYRLISLWPINPTNAPYNEAERRGLESVLKHPDEPVKGTVKVGGETYFQAIYADRAVTQACVGCHNAHPKTQKKDFKLNDVMGGLVIEIPMDRR
ncbi:Tll0287-like domain-containing protein [Petrachloros mirabilis]